MIPVSLYKILRSHMVNEPQKPIHIVDLLCTPSYKSSLLKRCFFYTHLCISPPEFWFGSLWFKFKVAAMFWNLYVSFSVLTGVVISFTVVYTCFCFSPFQKYHSGSNKHQLSHYTLYSLTLCSFSLCSWSWVLAWETNSILVKLGFKADSAKN